VKKIIYGLFVISIVAFVGVLALYNARVSSAGENHNNHKECRWGEWEDTTACVATECGNPVGLKGQKQECVAEVCEYSCPVIHFEWTTQSCPKGYHLIRDMCWKMGKPPVKPTEEKHSADVEYNKSQDPHKCHRPSDNTLRTKYGMNKDARDAFKRANSQWKPSIPDCHLEVQDTRARRTECRLDEVVPCGTIRWCFPIECKRDCEHKYEARAIPNNEEPKEGFKWETGMDKWCEYPPEPTPTPTPTPEPKRELTEAGAPICPDGVPLIVPANPHVVRDGSDATVNAHILEGDRVNIYFRENSEGEWAHAERDIPVVGQYLSHTIHDLNPALGYTFGIQAANGCAGGETVLAVVIDPPANGVTFPFSYWEWLR
jgi:hypothetical protein